MQPISTDCGQAIVRRLHSLVFLAVLACGILASHAQTVPQAQGSISGVVTDSDGELIPGAHVTLTSEAIPGKRLAVVDGEGRFAFTGVVPGKFTIAVTSDGFKAGVASGLVHSAEAVDVPAIILSVATATTDVEVNLSRQDLAEAEIHVEEKQRLFGFAPNFFVSYTWKAAPLTSKQKWELAGKTMIDPVSFAIIGGFAGIQQARNDFSGFGQGAQGYGKRYGANYADFAIGTTLGGAVFPILFRQDPRYFYKGTGSKRSRALYALSTAVIARGDNGKWQPAYAGILGDMSAGAFSNLYYPASDRNGVSVTLGNGFLSIALDGLGNVAQEFFFRKASSGVQKTPKP